jgi:hypothetical protein
MCRGILSRAIFSCTSDISILPDLDQIVDPASRVAQRFSLKKRVVVQNVVGVDVQSLDYGQPVLEHDVLELQAQYAVDIRQPRQRSAFDAPTVGLDVFEIKPQIVVAALENSERRNPVIDGRAQWPGGLLPMRRRPLMMAKLAVFLPASSWRRCSSCSRP